jgi:hypothetical protein
MQPLVALHVTAAIVGSNMHKATTIKDIDKIFKKSDFMFSHNTST